MAVGRASTQVWLRRRRLAVEGVTVAAVVAIVGLYVFANGSLRAAGVVAACLIALFGSARFFNARWLRGLLAAVVVLVVIDFAVVGEQLVRAADPPEAEWSEVVTSIDVDAEGIASGDPVATDTTQVTIERTRAETVGADGEPITSPADPTNFVERIDRGGEARVRQGLNLWPGAQLGRLEIGAFGWTVLAVAAALFWRRLEIINARRKVTPIEVDDFVVPGAYEDAKRLTARLRIGLAHAGILEPASLPGGNVADGIIEVFASDSGPGSWLTPVLKMFKLAIPRRGTRVIPVLESVDPPQVSVQVVSARRGRTLYAHSFALPTVEESIDRAASYIAQAAHNHSDATPAWARWHSVDAEAYDLFVAVRSNRQLPAALGKIETNGNKSLQMHALRLALGRAPSSGIVRVELGHHYDLLGANWRWTALRLHLEAAHDHPRLVVARYRVAATLSLLAGEYQACLESPGATPPVPADDGDLEAILAFALEAKIGEFEHDGLQAMRTQPKNAERASIKAAVIQLLAWAEKEIDECGRLVGLWQILRSAALYPDERAYWWDLLFDRERRSRLQGQVGMVRQIITLRQLGYDSETVGDHRRLEDGVIDLVEKHPGVATFYNAACFYAVSSTIADTAKHTQLDKAIEMLHQSRRYGGTGFPSAQWLCQDPDLRPLHRDAQFKQLVEWTTRATQGLVELRKKDTGKGGGDEDSTPFEPTPESMADWHLHQQGLLYETVRQAVALDLTDAKDPVL